MNATGIVAISPETEDPFLQATAVWLRWTPVADLWVSVSRWTERLHNIPVIQESEPVIPSSYASDNDITGNVFLAAEYLFN